MNPWRWVDPRVGQISLNLVRRYLAARGWEEKLDSERMVVFEGPAEKKGAARPTCRLPASETVPDFELSLTYFLTTLSEIEDRHPVAILEDMIAAAGCSRAIVGTSSRS